LEVAAYSVRRSPSIRVRALLGRDGSRGGCIINQEGGFTMIRKIALLVATLFAAGTAFAFHCPADMKKIDDAMAKNPTLTAAQTDEVKKYRAEGETLHKAGKHQESIDTLAKAMKILDIK
jgi:hypothetical protein